jgi:hypothetical protein
MAVRGGDGAGVIAVGPGAGVMAGYQRQVVHRGPGEEVHLRLASWK